MNSKIVDSITFTELARRLLVFAARYHAEGDSGWALEASTFILESAANAALRKPEIRAKIDAEVTRAFWRGACAGAAAAQESQVLCTPRRHDGCNGGCYKCEKDDVEQLRAWALEQMEAP